MLHIAFKSGKQMNDYNLMLLNGHGVELIERVKDSYSLKKKKKKKNIEKNWINIFYKWKRDYYKFN